MSNPVKVVLPEHYDLVVGDTFQLFYLGIIEAANPFCYDIFAECAKGRNFPRYFEFLPEEADIGTHTLTVSVFANDKTLLASGTTQLRVCQAERSPEKTTHILCVGDSLTAGGVWVNEAHRRLTATDGVPCGLGLKNLRFIGTCEKEDGVGFEGYGGWRWDNYFDTDYRYGSTKSAVWMGCALPPDQEHNITEEDQHSLWKDETGAIWQLESIADNRPWLKFTPFEGQKREMPKTGTYLTHYQNAKHTDSLLILDDFHEIRNPFYDEESESVNFQAYCRRNGFPRIDAAYILLTWNGLWTLLYPGATRESVCQDMVADGKRLVDILHRDYPDAQVKIMGLPLPSVTGGCGANYGARLPYADDYGQSLFAMELNLAYEAWCCEPDYRDFMEFINISGQFDTYYNMPWMQKPVNTRSTQTELVGTNGSHPSTEGYLQIGDAAFRNMVKSFCQK